MSSFQGSLVNQLNLAGLVFCEVMDDPRTVVGKHSHEQAQLCLVLSDGYDSSARGLGGACDRGTVIYNPAGTCHSDRFVRRGGRFLAVSLSQTLVRTTEERARLPEVARGSGGPRAAACIARVSAEIRCADSCTALELEALVLELLELATEGEVRSSRALPPWLRVALDALRDAPSEGVSVRTLAREANVHPVSLARAFRRHLGAGPGEYLRWTRIERSLVALQRSEIPIAQVAQDAGFSDQTSFTRAFRKLLRLTPAAYRARMASGAGRRLG